MKTQLLIFLLLGLQLSILAQHVNRKSIIEKYYKIDTAHKNKVDELFYIVNGFPYELGDKVDSALKSYDIKYLDTLEFFIKDPINIYGCHAFRPFVLVEFAYKQKIKKKRRLWSNVKNSINKSYNNSITDSHKPILYINNELINNAEVRKNIKALSLKKIYCIDYYNNLNNKRPVKQYPHNEIIKIWTVSGDTIKTIEIDTTLFKMPQPLLTIYSAVSVDKRTQKPNSPLYTSHYKVLRLF